ncbi:uncharacterized protein [Dysidea avara]|uniref:uncharacterized protein n=1 Tax=Dysidea avara TaxID=196820 RepID=UPI00333169CB
MSQAQENTAEHKSYLERTKVLAAVQDVLQQLVEDQPDDPLLFLSDHFEKLTRPPVDPVQKAVSLLQSCSDSTDASDVIYECFLLLNSEESWNHVQDGVIGITFNGFLRRLFSDLDKGELLKTLLQPDDDRIEFKMFNSIITTYLESKQAKSS